MEKIQEEICDELISHADTKKEVLIAMADAFPKIEMRIIKKYISTNWVKKPNEKMISIIQMSYRGKRALLSFLLDKKEAGKLKKIFIYIKKDIKKEIPYEMYLSIVGKNNFNAQGRESLRGKKVELISFSSDMGKIIIEDAEWEGKQFYFTIWDINCRRCIETK